MQYIGKWTLRSKLWGLQNFHFWSISWNLYVKTLSKWIHFLTQNKTFSYFLSCQPFLPLVTFLDWGICLESFLKECRNNSSLLATRAWRFDRIRIWKTFGFLYTKHFSICLEFYFQSIKPVLSWLPKHIRRSCSTFKLDPIIKALVLRSKKPLLYDAVVVNAYFC